MAQLSLSRAKQVINRIAAETAFGEDTEHDVYHYSNRRQRSTSGFNLRIEVSVDGPVVQQAEAYQRAALGKLTRMFDLMDVGTKIRSALAAKNAECGVTALVSERVVIQRKIKVLDTILATIDTEIFDARALEEQAQLIKSRLNSASTTQTTATIATTVLTAENRDNLTHLLNQLRSDLMTIDDELGRLNAANQITISDEDLATLQDIGLAGGGRAAKVTLPRL